MLPKQLFIPECFSSAKTEILYLLKNNFPFPSFWQPLAANIILFFVSVSLSILGIPCKWNNSICIFVPDWLHLTKWTQVSYIAGRLFTNWATREDLQQVKQSSEFIHVVSCVRVFILFKSEYCIVCIYHILLLHSSVDGTLGLLLCFSYHK